MLPKLKVLFLCTGNSCRSQMAEAWARVLHGDRIEAYSAGTNPKPIDPRAVEVMREAGVSMDGQRSKHVQELAGVELDRIVTVCDNAHETCPAYLGSAPKIHRDFDDPPRLAMLVPPDQVLSPYRRVRDEIREVVAKLPSILDAAARAPESAQARDLAQVLELLAQSALPAAGVAEHFPVAYSVLRAGTEVIAVAGLETHGSVGLLRSVAVAAPYRGLGLGQRMVEDRLDIARRKGLDAIYLLTTTAAPFFRGLGFQQVARQEVPQQLQASSEFASVCPATATCLYKTL